MSGYVSSGQVRLGHCLMWSGHVKVTLVHFRLGQEMTMSGQVMPSEIRSDQIRSGLVKSDKVMSAQVKIRSRQDRSGEGEIKSG